MDRYSVSSTKRSLFYIIMAFLTIGFIIAECVFPSERSQAVSDDFKTQYEYIRMTDEK